MRRRLRRLRRLLLPQPLGVPRLIRLLLRVFRRAQVTEALRLEHGRRDALLLGAARAPAAPRRRRLPAGVKHVAHVVAVDGDAPVAGPGVQQLFKHGTALVHRTRRAEDDESERRRLSRRLPAALAPRRRRRRRPQARHGSGALAEAGPPQPTERASSQLLTWRRRNLDATRARHAPALRCGGEAKTRLASPSPRRALPAGAQPPPHALRRRAGPPPPRAVARATAAPHASHRACLRRAGVRQTSGAHLQPRLSRAPALFAFRAPRSAAPWRAPRWRFRG